MKHLGWILLIVAALAIGVILWLHDRALKRVQQQQPQQPSLEQQVASAGIQFAADYLSSPSDSYTADPSGGYA